MKAANSSFVGALLFDFVKIQSDTTFISGTNSAPCVPGLKVLAPAGQVIVLNVYDPQNILNCPVDRCIDFFNDFTVVFRNVILQVDYDKCAVFHNRFLHIFLTP